jgi:hypothetical protein
VGLTRRWFSSGQHEQIKAVMYGGLSGWPLGIPIA